MQRPKGLPDFCNPPLNEVALSLQFERVNLSIVDIGLFAESVRDKFPDVSQRAPLRAMYETFSHRPQIQKNQIDFVLSREPEFPRIWLESSEGNDLLQLQQDRLIRNWKAGEGSTVYPRYEYVRSEMEHDFSVFANFIESRGYELPVINQCEVVYVNIIEMNDRFLANNMGNFFKGWNSEIQDQIDLETISLSFSSIYRKNQEPYARLHFEIHPGIKEKGINTWNFNLIFRGSPAGPNLSDALQFFDTGRFEIVNKFSELTTDYAHRFWEKTNE